jgi:hypothetical protein
MLSTYDTNTGIKELWREGVKVDSQVLGQWLFSGGLFQIGRGFASANFFDGKLRDCAIWSRVLTPGEIAKLARGVSPSEIRRGSLVAHWPMDDAGGARDLGPNGIYMTESGSTTGGPDQKETPYVDAPINPRDVMRPGYVGRAFAFPRRYKAVSSSSSYFDANLANHLTYPDGVPFDFSNINFTLACWFKPAAGSFAAQQMLIAKHGSSAGEQAYIMYIENTAGFGAYVDDGGGNTSILSAAGTVVAGVWQHFTMMQNASGLYGFVNGKLVTSGGPARNPRNSPVPFYVGRYNNASPANGDMAHAAVWAGYSLTFDQIQRLADGEPYMQVQQQSCLGYWPMGAYGGRNFAPGGVNLNVGGTLLLHADSPVVTAPIDMAVGGGTAKLAPVVVDVVSGGGWT